MITLVRAALAELEAGAGHPQAAARFDLTLTAELDPTDDMGSRADHLFRVAFNVETGFGALVWCVFPKRPGFPRNAIDEEIWVSGNPEPPQFDPLVLADPWLPSYFDRRCALPASRIIVALEAFCRAGTGDRPDGVDWAPGDLAGRWLSAEAAAERAQRVKDRSVHRSEDLWAEAMSDGFWRGT
jgi:hypothetical protein